MLCHPSDITMYETLLRPHEVNQAPRLIQIDTVAEKLKQLERNREAKRQRQIAASRARRNATEKRKREEEDEEEVDNNAGGGGGGVDVDPSVRELEAKKAKTVLQQSDDDVVMDVVDEETLEDQQQLELVAATATAAPPAPVPPMQVLSRHSKEVRGHTSFLTFACLLPITRLQTATS
jgi:tRNA (adenine57-N1/adenine58-N1)-methyltransferase